MLYIFKRSSILDVWLCSEYASEFNCKQSLGWWGTNIPNTHEKSIKNQSVTEWYWCGKYGAMNKKCRMLVLPQNWSHEILWIIGYEIWWMQSTRLFLHIFFSLELLVWSPLLISKMPNNKY